MLPTRKGINSLARKSDQKQVQTLTVPTAAATKHELQLAILEDFVKRYLLEAGYAT